MAIHHLTLYGVMYSMVHTLLSECNTLNGNASTAATVEALNSKTFLGRNDMSINNTKKVSCTVLHHPFADQKPIKQKHAGRYPKSITSLKVERNRRVNAMEEREKAAKELQFACRRIDEWSIRAEHHRQMLFGLTKKCTG